MGLREFAEHIRVSPDTLTSAEKDRRKVRGITINAYALASGVSREWLETGKGDHVPPTPGPGKPVNEKLARLTEQKQSRARGPKTTRGYFPSFTPEPLAA